MKDKYRILIVDDAVDTVELLRKRFEAEGFETNFAYDGEEGLKKVYDYNPDLIILDIMMPKIDGYEVCQRLKSDESTKYIPILMLTAKGDIDHKVKGLDIGADDYLSKPFDYKELSARVRSLLATKAVHEKKVVEEKTEALEKMMDQVAHEIRNPLTSIGGFARKVYSKLPDGDPNKKYMDMIIQNVTVLEDMIKKLIEIKTVAVCYLDTTNVNNVIKESLEVFKQEIKDKAIEIKLELSDSVLPILADKKILKRAFCSIIKNAIEAMKEDTKILKITTKTKENLIEIEISDTGIGISKDKIKKIFDPFVTSKVYGPGLGLTFANKIIQDHNGTITVDSELGKGTTFTISLPLYKSST